MRRPMGQVGDGSFKDFAVFPVGFAQKDGGWRVTVGHFVDVHDHHDTLVGLDVNSSMVYYMGTFYKAYQSLSSVFSVTYNQKSGIAIWIFVLACIDKLAGYIL